MIATYYGSGHAGTITDPSTGEKFVIPKATWVRLPDHLITEISGSSDYRYKLGVTPLDKTQLNEASPITVTDDYSASVDDDIIYIDTSSNSVVVTLPTVFGQYEKEFVIKVIDFTNAASVEVASGTIESVASYTFTELGESIRVVSDGVNYRIINAYSAGGIAHTLAFHSDVSLTPATEGQALYNESGTYIPRDPYPSQTVVISVDGLRTEYSSFNDAVASIVDSAITKPYVISLHSGRFVIDNSAGPVQFPAFVTLKGVGEYAAVLEGNTAGNDLLEMAEHNLIEDVSIIGPASAYAVSVPDNVTKVRLKDITFFGGLGGIHITKTSNDTHAYVEGCKFIEYAGSSQHGILIEGGANAHIYRFFSRTAYPIKATGVGTYVESSELEIEAATTGIELDDGASAIITNLRFEDCTDCLETGTTGTNDITLIINSMIAENTSNYDIIQGNSYGKINIHHGTFNLDRVLLTSPINSILTFDNTNSNDPGYVHSHGMSVGMPEYGNTFDAGQGISYTRGMLVYTYDTSTYTDVSTAAKSATGSTFALPGTAVNNAIYFASNLHDGDYLKFYGIDTRVVTALDKGTGEAIFEYWNGSSWTEFKTEAMGNESVKYVPYRNTPFQRVADEYVFFGNAMLLDWAKNDPVGLGGDRFWIRFRVSVALTGGTAPVIEWIKLQTSRSRTCSDGFKLSFGLARPIKTIAWDYGLLEGIGSAPGNTDLYADSDLGVGRTLNTFSNVSDDKVGITAYLPHDMDTSCPIEFKWTWRNSNADTGNIRWVIYYGFTADGDILYTSATSTGIQSSAITDVSASGVTGSQQTIQALLDLSNADPEQNILWLEIVRPAASDGADTHTGSPQMANFQASYVANKLGGHL